MFYMTKLITIPRENNKQAAQRLRDLIKRINNPPILFTTRKEIASDRRDKARRGVELFLAWVDDFRVCGDVDPQANMEMEKYLRATFDAETGTVQFHVDSSLSEGGVNATALTLLAEWLTLSPVYRDKLGGPCERCGQWYAVLNRKDYKTQRYCSGKCGRANAAGNAYNAERKDKVALAQKAIDKWKPTNRAYPKWEDYVIDYVNKRLPDGYKPVTLNFLTAAVNRGKNGEDYGLKAPSQGGK